MKHINLAVKVGQTIALVGNSGGGKTTLVNLLPRFYDITSGSLTIDGIDVCDLELNSLRDKIAVVFRIIFCLTVLSGKTFCSATRRQRRRRLTQR